MSISEAARYVRKGFAFLVGAGRTEGLRAALTQGAAGSFVVIGANNAAYFFTGLLLARLLGPEGRGVYAYVLAWISVLAVPAVLGLDQLTRRSVAGYRTSKEWGLLRGLMDWSSRISAGLSVALMIIVGAVVALVISPAETQVRWSFWIALLLLPLMALTRLRQATLQGFFRITMGQIPEMVVRPFGFLALVGLTRWILGDRMQVAHVMATVVVAWWAAFVLGARLLGAMIPPAVKQAVPAYRPREWLASAVPLFVVAGVRVVHAETDVLILGALRGAAEVGIYAVANRLAWMITFGLTVVNMVLGPAIASLYAKGDLARLQRIVTMSARAALAFAFPVTAALLLFGPQILRLMGPQFVAGRAALSIMSLGQLVNVGMGSVGLLLLMTRYEREAAVGFAVSAILNLILQVSLIHLWGFIGASVATAVSTVTWNVLMAIWVYRRLGIVPSAVGGVVHRRGTER